MPQILFCSCYSEQKKSLGACFHLVPVRYYGHLKKCQEKWLKAHFRATMRFLDSGMGAELETHWLYNNALC